MAIHGLGYRNAPYQMDPNFDWGLCRDAFHSCNGFTYNVTRRDSIPKFQELKMVTGKSPKICSRSISDRNSIRIQNESHSPIGFVSKPRAFAQLRCHWIISDPVTKN